MVGMVQTPPDGEGVAAEKMNEALVDRPDSGRSPGKETDRKR